MGGILKRTKTRGACCIVRCAGCSRLYANERAASGPTALHSHAHCSQIYPETGFDRLREAVRGAKLTRTALIFVGRALTARQFRDSTLYDAARPHLLRPFTDTGKKRRSDARKNR